MSKPSRKTHDAHDPREHDEHEHELHERAPHDGPRDGPQRLLPPIVVESVRPVEAAVAAERAANAECAENLERLRTRHRVQELERRASVQTNWRGLGPEPPLIDRVTAMRGRAGEDFFPTIACTICHAVPYWNGRKIVTEHDPARHAVSSTPDDPRHVGLMHRGGAIESPAKLSALAEAQLMRARRAFGEHDEED